MNGYRFYLEYPNKTSKNKATVKHPEGHSGTVIAVLTECYYYSHQSKDIVHDAIGGLFSDPNSVVCSTGVSQGYLNDNCKRIPEKLAREIHPVLFEYLDS